MNITQKDVKKWKEMKKKLWHDSDWHNFMSTSTSSAISYAISEKNHDDTLADITKRANEFLENNA